MGAMRTSPTPLPSLLAFRDVCIDPDEVSMCATCTDLGGHLVKPGTWIRSCVGASLFVFTHGGRLKLIWSPNIGFLAEVDGVQVPGVEKTATDAYRRGMLWITLGRS